MGKGLILLIIFGALILFIVVINRMAKKLPKADKKEQKKQNLNYLIKHNKI